jgi:hypothetical protein
MADRQKTVVTPDNVVIPEIAGLQLHNDPVVSVPEIEVDPISETQPDVSQNQNCTRYGREIKLPSKFSDFENNVVVCVLKTFK